MHRLISSLMLALLFAALFDLPAAAQRRDFTACDAKSNTETRMRVCTAAINSGLFRGKKAAINYNNRGWAYNDKGEYERGLADLNEAIRLDPRLWPAYSNRGESYFRKKDYDRALEDFSESLRLNPNHLLGLLRRGMIFDLKGDHDRALKEFDEAVRSNPKNAVAYASRGSSLFQKRDYDRALADFNEAIRLDPKLVAAVTWRGQAFYEKGDYDRAINDYNEARRLDPKQADPLLRRSVAQEAKGDVNAAYRDVVEALALNPSNVEGQQRRDRLRAVLSGPVPAPKKAEEASATSPNNPSIAPQPSPAIEAMVGPRVALVIGNGRYQHSNVLANPANDAADISTSLRKLGFEVIEGRDLDKRGMEDRVRQFGRKLDGAKLALFFYAGHGLQVGGRNYLIPIDGKLERQGDLSFETIDVSQVLAQMESEQRVNLVFLDACRDNPLSRSFARSLGTRSSAVGQGLASIQSAVGTMIAYATQPDAVALDGTGRNSPFTTALLKHINTRGLEIGSMMRRVRAEVVQVTGGKQVPWDHSSLLGDVVLVQ